jgi:hypothetical protein
MIVSLLPLGGGKRPRISASAVTCSILLVLSLRSRSKRILLPRKSCCTRSCKGYDLIFVECRSEFVVLLRQNGGTGEASKTEDSNVTDSATLLRTERTEKTEHGRARGMPANNAARRPQNTSPAPAQSMMPLHCTPNLTRSPLPLSLYLCPFGWTSPTHCTGTEIK